MRRVCEVHFTNLRSSNTDPNSEECGNMVIKAKPVGMICAIDNVNGEDGGSRLEPQVGLEFDSSDDARECYSLYAKRMGFKIRTGQLYRSRTDGSVSSRRFVCSKEGFQTNSRTGCPAFIRVQRNAAGKWVIDHFFKDHNHDLESTGENPTPVMQSKPPVVKKSLADVTQRSKVKLLEDVEDRRPCPSGVINVKRVKRDGDDGQSKVQPFLGLVFNSANEAYQLYHSYGANKGFRVRIGQLFRSRHDGSISSRRFVCSKEGFQHPSRVGCGAYMRIKRQESGTWVVDRLREDHNHGLGTQMETHKGSLNASNRFIEEVNGVGTSQELKALMLWSLRETACKYIEAGSASLEKYKLAYEIMREGGRKLSWHRIVVANPDYLFLDKIRNLQLLLFICEYLVCNEEVVLVYLPFEPTNRISFLSHPLG
nr:protein far1-related sequence 7 [Quercus suber]